MKKSTGKTGLVASILGMSASAFVLFSVTAAKPSVHEADTTIGIVTTSIEMKNASDVSSAGTLFDAENFVKPTDTELKKTLSSIEYRVTQRDGTERPFANPYYDEKRAGLYVDIVSGEPLFSSSDKFDSGTGWPSFTQPIAKDALIEKEDRSLFSVRTEIRSAVADSHLGHVFNDGPAPTGMRYCMNSAAMRFIPLEDMTDAGYAAYVDRVSDRG